MVSLRRFDAFTKTRPDLQEKSVVGGVITLIASTTAAILFIGQIYLYIVGSTRQQLALSKSLSTPLVALQEQDYDKNFGLNRRGRTNLYIHVTFPHIDCDNLDVMHDGASQSTGELEKVHGSHSLILRKPSASEIRKVLGGKVDNTINSGKGCTVIGQLHPYIVAGSFSVCLSMHAWSDASAGLAFGLRMPGLESSMAKYNVSHYIHSIRFGHAFPKATDKPLEDVSHMIVNDFYGIAVSQTQVKLVPTVTRGNFYTDQMYQMSVVDITVQPSALIANGAQQLPGLTVTYDITPLTVHHSDGRESFLVFLSSLISIVGGVFVTVGLVTGCLFHSVEAVSKKID